MSDGLVDAAASGSRLAALEALRGVLATRLAECDSNRDVAALSARFLEVLAQIEELTGGMRGGESERTGLSEFERKLAERTGAKSPGRQRRA